MFRRLRTGRARWAAGAAAALALAGVGLVVVASPAQAVPFPFTDDFEGVPTDRWFADEIVGQTTVRLGNHANARSGTKVAMLNAGPLFPSRARIVRTVTPDVARQYTCSISLSARRVINDPPPDPQSVNISLKIRAGASNGHITFASLTSVYHTDGWEQRWNAGTTLLPAGTFTIDISAMYGRALIDDLTFAC